MELLHTILDRVAMLWANEAARSLLFGLVVAIAGTQWLKFRIPVPADLQDEYVWFIRIVSLPLGFAPVYFTWPLAYRGWVALCVGLTVPWVYKLAVKLLYWKWPQLEAHLSAQPGSPKIEDALE